MNETPLQRMWASAWACLAVSPLALLLGGAAVLAAIEEDYGRHPQFSLVVGLTTLGVGFFALGVMTWMRAFGLVARQVRERRSPAA